LTLAPATSVHVLLAVDAPASSPPMIPIAASALLLFVLRRRRLLRTAGVLAFAAAAACTPVLPSEQPGVVSVSARIEDATVTTGTTLTGLPLTSATAVFR
jgi:hypothetical protein